MWVTFQWDGCSCAPTVAGLRDETGMRPKAIETDKKEMSCRKRKKEEHKVDPVQSFVFSLGAPKALIFALALRQLLTQNIVDTCLEDTKVPNA
ncbi:hypothetical protein M0R45_001578 [Rubus argutus]|uniref:Uncharacterized protein n=1 Tax=Rubus argutus TaxID=59490 RepID=A0AAW1VLX7_RUBAR